jgi:hypothetical protein
LNIDRNSFYFSPKGEGSENLSLKKLKMQKIYCGKIFEKLIQKKPIKEMVVQ